MALVVVPYDPHDEDEGHEDIQEQGHADPGGVDGPRTAGTHRLLLLLECLRPRQLQRVRGSSDGHQLVPLPVSRGHAPADGAVHEENDAHPQDAVEEEEVDALGHRGAGHAGGHLREEGGDDDEEREGHGDPVGEVVEVEVRERELRERAQDDARQERRQQVGLEPPDEEELERQHVPVSVVEGVSQFGNGVNGDRRPVPVDAYAAARSVPLRLTTLERLKVQLHVARLGVEGEGEEVVLTREGEQVLDRAADHHIRSVVFHR